MQIFSLKEFIFIIIVLFSAQIQIGNGKYLPLKPHKKETKQSTVIEQSGFRVGSESGSSVNQQQQSQCTSLSANTKSSISVGNCQEQEYYIQLQLGSNSQKFNFLFDTGSNTLWIPLISPDTPQGFNSSSSTTYQDTGSPMKISYLDGSSTSGEIGTDTIALSSTAIKVTGTILFATQVEVNNMAESLTGLVGMGYSTSPNFLDLAYKAGQISTSVFSLQLNYANETSYFYYDNGLNQSVMSNTIWIQQYQQQHWQVQVIGMFAGGVQFTSSASPYAVIDSGTSLFYLNQQLYNSITTQFFSNASRCHQNYYHYNICPCSTTDSWPDLAFMFIGAEVYIKASQYTIDLGNGSCQANFGLLSSTPYILLGDTFFRKYIISFDKIGSQIGFYGDMTPIYIVGGGKGSGSALMVAIYVLAGLFSMTFCFGCYSMKGIRKLARKISYQNRKKNSEFNSEINSDRNYMTNDIYSTNSPYNRQQMLFKLQPTIAIWRQMKQQYKGSNKDYNYQINPASPSQNFGRSPHTYINNQPPPLFLRQFSQRKPEQYDSFRQQQSTKGIQEQDELKVYYGKPPNENIQQNNIDHFKNKADNVKQSRESRESKEQQI